MPKLHDLLCQHLLREALDPIGTVKLEKPVAPLDEHQCLLRAAGGAASGGGGGASGALAAHGGGGAAVSAGAVSATPSVESIDDNPRKKFNLHHGLKKVAKGSTLAKSALRVLSPGRPEDVLQGYAGSSVADWPSGFCRCAPELATWVVVLAELPRMADTILLRLRGPVTMQLEALRELDALQLSETQRQPWLGKRLGDADGKLLAPKKETIALEVIPVERKLLPPKRDELRSDERHRGMLRRQHELCVPGLGHRA